MAALSIAIADAQKRKRSDRQRRAETRLDEIVSVGAIGTDYQTEDRRGDLEVESRFLELYQLVDSKEEKDAVARAFAVWTRSEKAEERVVMASVGGSVNLLRENNNLWLHDGCGPDGSAA